MSSCSITSVMTEGHIHPVVQFQLYRDGQAYGDPVDMAPPDNTAALTGLPHTWGELPKYRADGAVNEQGQRIESVYTVKEVLVPDSYVMRIPASTGEGVPIIQNIYWPLARTVHKFWDGPAPEPGTNEIWIEIYQEIRLTNLSLTDPYTAREKYPVDILMDGEPDAFPDPIPTNQFEVHGEFSPWTYTIVLPVTGTYNGQDVNYYYTVKEVRMPADYKVGTTAVLPGKGADVTNVYQFTSFTANKV